MVAQAVGTKSQARGARPFDPTRDLAAVARLLEEAFRSEHTFPLSTAPGLREMGIFLWTLSYAPVFPENVSGFVWVEDGRIVGNVTLSLDEGRLDRFLISNVAVKPSYQRRGIARALMQVALDHIRDRGAKWVLLNVRPMNASAVKLYRDLGFQEVEMRGEWYFPAIRLSSPDTHVPSLSPDSPAERGMRSTRPLRSSDGRAVTALLRSATPEPVQQFRSPRWTEFGPNWEDRLTESVTDFFVGQVTHRWVLEQDNRLAAVMVIRGQRIFTPHYMMIQVHPDYRGMVENDLVAFALRDLAHRSRREIHAAATSTHPELITALEQHGFRFRNGLMLMARALQEPSGSR